MKELFSFSLMLDSYYKWGRGMSPTELSIFEKEVYPKLEASKILNMKIKKPESRGTSPELLGEGEEYIYLHPMEFAGILPAEKIVELKNIINQCDPSIVKVDCVRQMDKITSITLEDLKKELKEKEETILRELRLKGTPPAMNSQYGVNFPSQSKVLKDSWTLADYNYKFLKNLYDTKVAPSK